MHYSIPVGTDVFSDLRYLCTVVVAAYMGWIPSLLSSAVIGLGRIFLFGATQSAVVACIGMVLIGICCSFLSKAKWSSFTKINLMNVLGAIITYFTLYINVGDNRYVMSFYPQQVAITLLGGLFLYMITQYILSSNALFAQMKKNAHTDHLTSLNNLRQFEVSLRQELDRAVQHHHNLSILAIDIDHFKAINDKYGHPAGDAVLKQLGKLLIEHSRSFDIVSRNGGEEFSVLLLDCPSTHAMRIAERIRLAIQDHVFRLPDERKIRITVSIGVASYSDIDPGENGQQLVQLADQALYHAKAGGRNQVCLV